MGSDYKPETPGKKFQSEDQIISEFTAAFGHAPSEDDINNWMKNGVQGQIMLEYGGGMTMDGDVSVFDANALGMLYGDQQANENGLIAVGLGGRSAGDVVAMPEGYKPQGPRWEKGESKDGMTYWVKIEPDNWTDTGAYQIGSIAAAVATTALTGNPYAGAAVYSGLQGVRASESSQFDTKGALIGSSLAFASAGIADWAVGGLDGSVAAGTGAASEAASTSAVNANGTELLNTGEGVIEAGGAASVSGMPTSAEIASVKAQAAALPGAGTTNGVGATVNLYSPSGELETVTAGSFKEALAKTASEGTASGIGKAAVAKTYAETAAQGMTALGGATMIYGAFNKEDEGLSVKEQLELHAGKTEIDNDAWFTRQSWLMEQEAAMKGTGSSATFTDSLLSSNGIYPVKIYTPKRPKNTSTKKRKSFVPNMTVSI